MIALLEFAGSKHESILKKIRGFFCAMKIRDNDKLTVQLHGGQANLSAECMVWMGDNDQLVFMNFPYHQLFILYRIRDEPQSVVQARSLFHDKMVWQYIYRYPYMRIGFA